MSALEKHNRAVRAFRTRNPEHNKLYQRMKNGAKFGVVYPEMTHCGLCGKVISGYDLCLDHNHISQKFRGWLCRHCNQVVAKVEKLGVWKFKEYLEKA